MIEPKEERIKLSAGDLVELRESAERNYPYGWKKFRGLSGRIAERPVGNTVVVKFPGATTDVAVLVHNLRKVEL